MAGSSARGDGNRPPLFATEKPTRTAAYAYRLFASTVLAGVLLVWLYRATHLPLRSSSARWWAWLGLSVAELWCVRPLLGADAVRAVEPRLPPPACAKPQRYSPIPETGVAEMHKDLTERVNSVVDSGKIPEVSKCEPRDFYQWSENTSFKDHPSMVQILADGNKRKATAVDGNALPTLVYMWLIRVSSVISNIPVIMNVDCDMYSNNSGSIRDALCFFLDEEQGQDIAFVQYPQNFESVVHNNIYGNPINTINELDHPCLDGWGGMCYYGTGCFHRREALGGRIYSLDYKEDWTRVVRKTEDVRELEGMAESLVTCTYEHNTLWGIEKGVRYGCALEDVITGLQIQCRGWRSALASISLGQILVQHKRWTEGFLHISLSKHSPFVLGHRKIKLGLQMGYSVCGFWALNSFRHLVSSPWFLPFVYVVMATCSCNLVESLQCSDTVVEWWNAQSMWLFRRITSYLLAAIDTIRGILDISESGFALMAKVSDLQALHRYREVMMDFGSFSTMFVIIATVALLNLTCLMFGVAKVLLDEGATSLGAIGRLPASVSLVSLCILLPLCILLLPINF
ncbi:hypothetical protein BS78_04G260100 [Paspalum vaginatum]|nr:hypothetical protein BS78_04G260100 [Paspalum vaginatum]